MPSKKTLVIVALVAVFFIATVINEELGAAVLMVYFFAGGFWFLYKSIKAAIQKYCKKPGKPRAPQASTSAQVMRQNVSSLPPELWEGQEDDVAYYYRHVGVYVPDTSVLDRPDVKEGAIVHFRQEPENKYDSGAVAVVIGRKRIGYLYRGRLQDMANDWLDRGDSISGRITNVNPYVYDKKKDSIQIDLYFYE